MPPVSPLESCRPYFWPTMPPETYTPAQAAQLLNIHGNTVRTWCTEYGDVLSDGARSRPRLLSPVDVATLQHVSALRAEGLSRSEVLERLRQLPTEDRTQPYIDAPTMPPAPLETPPVQQLPATVDVSALFVDLASMVDARATQTQEDVKRIDARLRTLESRRLLYSGVAIGIVAGLVLGVIVAVLLLRP